MTTERNAKPDDHAIMMAVLTKPEALRQAHLCFARYSVLNQVLVFVQCGERGIEFGPIATFMDWKKRGRSVRKGQQALGMFMPRGGRGRAEATEPQTIQADDGLAVVATIEGAEDQPTRRRFFWKNAWFVLSQTEESEGEDNSHELPEVLDKSLWNLQMACQKYGIEEAPRASTNVEAEGETCKEAQTFYHLAYCAFGHTPESFRYDPESLFHRIQVSYVALLIMGMIGHPETLAVRDHLLPVVSGMVLEENFQQHCIRAANALFQAGLEGAILSEPALTADD